MDLRIKRTRIFIRDAFFQLIDEQGFDAVSVRDITEKAMINRSTFYRHYQDKFDLAKRCLDDQFQELLEALDEEIKARNVHTDGPPRNFLLMLEHIEKHAVLYRTLFGRTGISIFISRFREYIIQLVHYRLQNSKGVERNGFVPIGMFEEYIAGAYLGVIQWWLDNMGTYSAKQVASWLYQLVVEGNLSALGLET